MMRRGVLITKESAVHRRVASTSSTHFLIHPTRITATRPFTTSSAAVAAAAAAAETDSRPASPRALSRPSGATLSLLALHLSGQLLSACQPTCYLIFAPSILYHFALPHDTTLSSSCCYIITHITPLSSWFIFVACCCPLLPDLYPEPILLVVIYPLCLSWPISSTRLPNVLQADRGFHQLPKSYCVGSLGVVVTPTTTQSTVPFCLFSSTLNLFSSPLAIRLLLASISFDSLAARLL
ncbi:hypothetical protein QBC37DRAFT_175362 [Rhypophila decipiens]|uniref:Uncharacterized protein n=1 Tax=Rhypophila decipiens TaxID=261697 RepID=A0AAN6Y8E3_9PEZI|nr:hypothetical protein QBC37DRAFT_175362 [Rhypophila decipiens]